VELGIRHLILLPPCGCDSRGRDEIVRLGDQLLPLLGEVSE
jgi:hypothetical protein